MCTGVSKGSRRSGEDGITPDFSAADLDNALNTGKVTVYSSKPIENGNFVTPSRMEAEAYSGGGKVYSQTVNTNEVAWLDALQGQMARRTKGAKRRK